VRSTFLVTVRRVNQFPESYNRNMETVNSPAEQRVVLHNIGWNTYERLLADHENNSAPRLTYDRGELEIMSPSPEHEKFNRRIAQLVLAVAEELNIEAEDLGSTTFRREDLERGFEPDSCFYIQNEEQVRGKDRIDLAVDPPPDLVIEIDITSPSFSKLPIYAQIGVPEVWRYDGEWMTILVLEGSDYAETAESIVLPPVTSKVLTDFVEKSKSMKRTAWLEEVREWSRENTGSSS
jgi:Uma2 family endonuclease